jgi:hypothetical protein
MTKFIIKESQYQKLLEQGVAMDLDIYSQPMTTASDNGNSDVEDAVDDIVSKMDELRSMLKSGKKIKPEFKTQIFRNLDQINQTFSNIKYEE